MKDRLLQITAGLRPEDRMQAAREYVQIYLLRLVHEQGCMRHMAFVGGTALRLLHRLPRFSEDLDFSLSTVHGEAPEIARTLPGRLLEALGRSGYEASARSRSKRNVSSTLFRLEGLPAEVGWSRDPRIALKVKIDIDLAPPEGAVIETTLIQRFFPIALRHHDLPSLFSGKLHALIARPHAKGRDWFDLVWYLTEKRGLDPNLGLLRSALEQTGQDPDVAPRWREEVAGRLAGLEWDSVLRDTSPFVERRGDLDHMRRDLVMRLLVG